ncbi:SDR family oxidoreductase [Nonomuraea fuscirosea]|uniref:SDR family oxidoreductase n=1 Tax=Nonomuraea fuscirosea TaxID=1291556 RepID=UPI002DD850B7|nr:SDR family oxidoreductase [Nonomuraea fuscirosea]WSA55705.1 SDR family oxidoreductase [Nonomuraea fuscirosea]
MARSAALNPVTREASRPSTESTERSMSACPSSVSETATLLRPGTPGDIAETVFFLASPGARHINGQTVHVNGGAFTTR